MGRRAAAWAIDFAVVLGVAVLLGSVTYWRIVDYLTGWPQLAERGVWSIITSNGDVAGTAKGTGLEILNHVIGLITQAFAALILITLLYHFIGLAWKERTIGKALLDVRIRPRQAEREKTAKGRVLCRAAATTMTDIGVYSLACIVLLSGAFILSVLLWLAAVAAFALNLVLLAGPRRRTLADRLGGTVVVRAGAYRRSWEAAKQGAQYSVHGVQAAADVARQEAARLAESERIRQLRESEKAQQLRVLGQSAGQRTADAARRAMAGERGQQAQQAGRRMGSKLKDAYAKRRAGRPQQEALPYPAPEQPALPPPAPFDPNPFLQGPAYNPAHQEPQYRQQPPPPPHP